LNKLNRMNELITQRVKDAVYEFDSEAAIFFFGSRARSDFRPDSDRDFLISLSQPLDRALKQAIRRRLYQIELESDTVISSLIHYRQDWEDRSVMPIYENIQLEGVQL